jgi:hypothetical protein
MHGASVPELTCLIPCDHPRTRGAAACWHARPREGARLKGKLMFVPEKRSGASLVRFVVPEFVPTGPLFRSEPPRLADGVPERNPPYVLR